MIVIDGATGHSTARPSTIPSTACRPAAEIALAAHDPAEARRFADGGVRYGTVTAPTPHR